MSASPSPPPLLAPQYTREAAESLATSVGGQLIDDAWGPWIEVGVSALPPGSFCAPLAELGRVRIEGEEAARFLHSQITNDVEHLQPGMARWGGYCSAKGRLLASFRYTRTDAGIDLVCSRTLAVGLKRRLSMFVLRAKVKITDQSDAQAIFGLCGMQAAEAAAQALGLDIPDAEGAASNVAAQLLSLPALPAQEGELARPRWLLIVAASEAQTVWAALTAAVSGCSAAVWRQTEVRSGVARVVGATVERFVPQRVNFESVGGVDFRKGCYPGQEVVARSQYLGKLKRRLFAAHLPGPVPEPATDVFPEGSTEPCGEVVLAAPDGQGGCELLFEAQTAAVETQRLLVNGQPLSLRPLPYTLMTID